MSRCRKLFTLCYSIVMASKKSHSGPPGSANAFRHGLSAIQRHRGDGELSNEEQDFRADILAAL